MKAPAPFTLKGARLPGKGSECQWLVEVSCRPPTGAAIAIVLDLSDSAGAMREEASKFARLIKHLPRTMPVWLYRLSSHVPATYERHPIAHFQDGTVELGNLLEEARTREFMVRRGSLFRPVLESIADRKRQELVSDIRVIVLTDGELLDAGELIIPAGITVLGLTRSSSDPKCQHWRRVLPTCPIYDLQDPALDRSFEDIHTCFFGACDVSWNTPDRSRITAAFNLSTDQVIPVTDASITWNFADQPLLLLRSFVDHDAQPLQLTCRSLKNQQSFDLIVQTELDSLDDSIVAAATLLLSADDTRRSNVLVDVRAGNPGFEPVREQFLASQRLAEARGPWRSGGSLQVWGDDSIAGLDSVSTADALVCLAGMADSSSEIDRIVVIGLQKRMQPALAIGTGPFLDMGESSAAFTISFDSREARWMLLCSVETHELDPRNSQILPLPLASTDGRPIVALFSGPLR